MSVVVLIILALAVVVSLALAGGTYSLLQRDLSVKLETAANFFEVYAASSGGDFASSAEDFAREFEDGDVLRLDFLDPDGTVLWSTAAFEPEEKAATSDVAEAISTLNPGAWKGTDPQTGERVLSVSRPVMMKEGQPSGLIRMVTSLRSADRHVMVLIAAVAVVAVLMLLLAVFMGFYFIRSIVSPVVDMTDTAKRITAGGYGVQIQKKFVENDDEVGELARTINNLSLQISQTEKMQSEFLSSVSHELRTPLTAISGWGETLLGSEELDPVMTRRGIVTILQETKRLTSLVEELLEFSRIQDGRFKLTMEQTDLRAVFEDTIFMYGNRLRQDGIELEYDETDQDIPEINCDGERMKQVFLNILDNAAKYGGSGGKILCGIRLVDQKLSVYIRDYGPGIPEEELPLVKKKFYRGTGTSRGSGIGLAVCEEIVVMHGGDLTITNAPNGTGCAVVIQLPVNN